MGIIQHMNDIDAINRRKYPSNAQRFADFKATWDDNDLTTWAESWDSTQRKAYKDSFFADESHGIWIATPYVYAMIQAVE